MPCLHLRTRGFDPVVKWTELTDVTTTTEDPQLKGMHATAARNALQSPYCRPTVHRPWWLARGLSKTKRVTTDVPLSVSRRFEFLRYGASPSAPDEHCDGNRSTRGLWKSPLQGDQP